MSTGKEKNEKFNKRPDSPVNELKSSLGKDKNYVIKDANSNIVIDESGVKIDNVGIEENNVFASGYTQKYTSEQLDVMRKHSQSYYFLCKCVEAKEWINKFVPCESVSYMITELPRGVILAKIAQKCGFKCQVHEVTEKEAGCYYEVENIYSFIRFCQEIGLNKMFMFETNDLRDMKNLRQVVYCLHALALLLKRKGIGEGIKKQKIELSEQEKKNWRQEEEDKMFDNLEIDMEKSCLQQKESLVKEPEEKKVFLKQNEKNNKTVSKTKHAYTCSVEDALKIRSFINTCTFSYAFKNVLYHYNVHLKCLKKFVHLIPEEEPEVVSPKLIDHFRRNLLLKNRIDDFYRNSQLLLQNQTRLRNIEVGDNSNDGHVLHDVEKTIYLFMTNYELVSNMVVLNEPIPLEIVYPSVPVGDHHFCKVILRLMERKFEITKIKEIVKNQFKHSQTYKTILNLFNSKKLQEINPIEIYKKMYNMSVYDDEAIYEVAMGEEKVRATIAQNVEELVNFVKNVNDAMGNIKLPVYCSLFRDQFKMFIKEILENSINQKYKNIIGEMIFMDLNSETSGITENIFKDFSSSFYNNFTSKYEELFVDDIFDIQELLIKRLENSKGIQIKTTKEKLNNLIVLFKRLEYHMRGELLSLVKKNTLLTSKKADQQVKLDLTDLYNENISHVKDSTVQTILKEVKKKIIALIKHTHKKDIVSMLYLRNSIDLENEMVESVDSVNSNEYCTMSTNSSKVQTIKDLKREVAHDLDFLEQEGICNRSNKYNEILQMIAQDLLKPELKEMLINDETVEMVAQRGETLRQNLYKLEKYYDALSSKMTKDTELFKKLSVRLDNSVISCQLPKNKENEPNIQLSITNEGKTIFRIEILVDSKVITEESFDLVNLIKTMRYGIQEIELGSSIKIKSGFLLKEINNNFIVY